MAVVFLNCAPKKMLCRWASSFILLGERRARDDRIALLGSVRLLSRQGFRLSAIENIGPVRGDRLLQA
jgi:hypothetical protein